MFFVEDKDFLTDQDKEVIEVTQNSDGVSYFYQRSFEPSLYEDLTHTLLCHVLFFRPEQRDEFNVKSLYNSDYSKVFENMLFRFCNKNNITCTEVIRGAINLTYNNGNEKCSPHVDHKDYHKQLIIYLNDPKDKESHTVIMDKDKKNELKRIVPEKYKGVCFENLPHYQVYPRFGDRVVAIFTFK